VKIYSVVCLYEAIEKMVLKIAYADGGSHSDFWAVHRFKLEINAVCFSLFCKLSDLIGEN
jgi:hypothetical protein